MNHLRSSVRFFTVILIFVYVELLNPGKAIGQLSLTSQSQPIVWHYTVKEYPGGNPIYSIAQDAQGILYFANTFGLLEFNGAEWNLHTDPDIAYVRSVFVDADGRIYCASYEEFGYWERDHFGELEYFSLSQKLLDHEDILFNTIWKIIRIEKYLYLHSFSKIFVYDGATIKVISSDQTMLPIFPYRGKIYTCILDSGLHFINENLELEKDPIPGLDPGIRIQNIFDYNQDSTVIFTEFFGIFLKVGDRIEKPKSPGNIQLEDYQINKVLRIDDKTFAIGTIKHGLLVTDCLGNIIYRIDKSNGLQNNTVLSIWLDLNRNLWLGLSSGIDFTRIFSPIYITKDPTGRLGNVTCAKLYQHRLYVGTNHGLFYTDWELFKRREPTEFVAVEELEGHVLSVDVINGQLICGYNLGSFRIEGEHAVQLYDVGGSGILVHPLKDHLGYQGIYTGIALYERNASGTWEFVKILKETDYVRYLQLDHEGNLWASGYIKGLQMHQLNDSGDSILNTIHFGVDDGLNSNYAINVFKLGEKLVIANGGSFFTFDYLANEIIPYTWLNEQSGRYQNAHVISRTGPMEYWFINQSSLGQFKYLYDSLAFNFEISYDFLDASPVDESGNISKIEDPYYLIGVVDGFALLDYSKVSEGIDHPQMRNIRINSFNSLKKGGSIRRVKLQPVSYPRIPFSYRNLNIHYSVPGLNQEPFTFSYRLSDIDPWTDLGNNNVLRHNNLRSGKYKLELKAVDESTGEATSVIFPFLIKAPWYFSWYSMIVYIFILITSGLIVRKLLKIRLHRHKMAYIQKVKAESEQKMAKYEQECLQREIRNKSKELLNYSILLDKRNELLNRLKTTLSKELESPEMPTEQLKQNLINSIDRNLSDRSDWQIFKSHFDAANSDFLEKLRTLHSKLTPSDLRFCGFLRMNLTSKEIASLLSISLRSVEVKRYRLRKKMELTHDQNLIEYLMNI